jgi:hypothetical protein
VSVTDELKDLGESCRGIIEVLMKTTTSLRSDGDQAEIGTERLPNTSLEIHRFSNQLSGKNTKGKANPVTGRGGP